MRHRGGSSFRQKRKIRRRRCNGSRESTKRRSEGNSRQIKIGMGQAAMIESKTSGRIPFGVWNALSYSRGRKRESGRELQRGL